MSEEATSPRPTFRDPELEERFLRDGFVLVDLAPPELVEELLEVYGRLDSGIDSGYYPSLKSPDVDYKERTHVEVRSRLWPLVDRLLDGYEPLLGVFMVKHPGPDSDCPIHQDWTISDSVTRPSVTAWMPLTPVTEETGRMHMLPGSNRWLEGVQGSPTFPTSWDGLVDRVRTELMVPIDVRPGQALVYDIRTLHGTPPNRSDRTRVVTSLYSIPEGSTPIHYYRDPEGTVTGYRVPSNFCTVFRIGDVPDGEPFVTIPEYDVPHLTFDEIADRYHATPAAAAWAAAAV